jgi:hypothetical protein
VERWKGCLKKMNCRLCGCDVHKCKGYLKRVNEKGIDGIWECRPSCTIRMTTDEALIAMLEDDELVLNTKE